MRWSKNEVIWSGVAVGAGSIAMLMLVERELGFDSIPHSYGELQYMSDAPHVSCAALVTPATLVATVTPSSSVAGGAIEFELADGLRSYQSAGEDGDPQIELEVMRTDAGGGVTITKASVPLVSALPFCTEDFAYPLRGFSRDALARADEIAIEAGINTGDESRSKILKLASYVCGRLEQHRGQPTRRMRDLDGLEQFDAALAGRSPVYCANHAEIFAMLATAAGVPTRLVDVGGKIGSVQLGAHTFNECFVAESNEWAYVDLELHVVLPQNEAGRLLNGIDVQLVGLTGSVEGLSVYDLMDGPEGRVPFEQVAARTSSFIPGSSTLTYLWASSDRFAVAERLCRLFVRPQPSFTVMRSGLGAIWRLMFTYVSLVAGIVVVAGRVRGGLATHAMTRPRQ